VIGSESPSSWASENGRCALLLARCRPADGAAASGVQCEELGGTLEACRPFELVALGVGPLVWPVSWEERRFVGRLDAAACGREAPDPPRVHTRLVHTAPSVPRSSAAGLLRDEPAEWGRVAPGERAFPDPDGLGRSGFAASDWRRQFDEHLPLESLVLD